MMGTGGRYRRSVNQNVSMNTASTAQNPYIEGAGGATGLMSNQPMGVGA